MSVLGDAYLSNLYLNSCTCVICQNMREIIIGFSHLFLPKSKVDNIMQLFF